MCKKKLFKDIQEFLSEKIPLVNRGKKCKQIIYIYKLYNKDI